MDIKAIFFDIDGTLLSHRTKCVLEDTRKAIEQLQKRGIKIFTATGRHIVEIDKLPIRDIKFDGYVLLNGQICLDQNREVLFGVPIDKDDLQKIVPLFEKKEIPISFVEKDRIYINFVNEKVHQVQQAISTPIPEVGEYCPGEPVYMVDVFSERETAYEVLSHMTHCKITWWNEYGTDIYSENGGKAAGIKKILEIYGISPEETMAFGDGENDLEMIKFAGIGVAMGNGEEKVKQCADYVTDDIDEGGVLHALQHFGIL